MQVIMEMNGNKVPQKGNEFPRVAEIDGNRRKC